MTNCFHKDVEDFLLLNGFQVVNDKYFENKYVRIHCWDVKPPAYYEVYVKKDRGSIFSHDLNIYWLIGILTYNGWMPRKYMKCVKK